jgi:DNA (cytosine-5)-methyltransferase 1
VSHGIRAHLSSTEGSHMTIKIAELFAGIGGFRIGFEGANKKLKSDDLFKVVWSNQWEPGEKAQHASRVYEHRFGSEGHSNEDISTVNPKKVPKFDVLVGGFPCQDYSVAKPLNKANGLEGKKGVLWWDIHRFMEAQKPKMAILENVDRLLVSPGNQRGRDFAIMLATLNDLGYAVEWRIINAAEYGFSQRRRRIFIVAHKNGTEGYRRIKSTQLEALLDSGLIATAFPVEPETLLPESFELTGEVWELTESFNQGVGKKSPFQNAGICINRKVTTQRMIPIFKGKAKTLGSVLIDESKVPEEYFISDDELKVWKQHKGAKRIMRTKKNGIQYEYAEGAMSFPDSVDKPARTIITSEGGRTPSRFKHVVETPSGRFRRLVPVELEQLSGFPKKHTDLPGINDSRRAFFIGNALVTGIIEKFAITIANEEFL